MALLAENTTVSQRRPNVFHDELTSVLEAHMQHPKELYPTLRGLWQLITRTSEYTATPSVQAVRA